MCSQFKIVVVHYHTKDILCITGEDDKKESDFIEIK